jgi:hypothetical protein
VDSTAPAAEPGIGMPNGFHIFCMKASASSAVKGGVDSLDASSLTAVSFAA